MAETRAAPTPESIPETPDTHHANSDSVHVIFKHNRIYTHNILRVNYTTYDVRRAQDTINPKTSHRDALFLADNGDNPDELCTHPFLYGRILGIYHANVVYIGPGMVDYRPRRVEFLWVRWFEVVKPLGSWASHTLDILRFPPMASEGAFGFVDPADVIRGCHIIPRFSKGMKYADHSNLDKGRSWTNSGLHKTARSLPRGLSTCAHDSEDWIAYFANR